MDKNEYEYKQVKSKAYYIFWGIATVAVVTGQFMMANSYRRLSRSVDRVEYTLYDGFRLLRPRPRFIPLPHPPAYEPPIYKEIVPVPDQPPIPNFVED
jgi:hypothetical protein